MERKREGEDYGGLHQWFGSTALPENHNRRLDASNSFTPNSIPEYHLAQNTPPPSENQMYWDPTMLPVLQNPPMLQNPHYHQHNNPNFNHLLLPGNSSDNLINNINGLSPLGFGTGGGAHLGTNDYFDPSLHHDQLATSLNRLSISNNGSSGVTSNLRGPNSFMPNSTSLGNGAFSTLEQEYLERLNQYAFLMAEQYMRRSNLTTANNGILNPHNWNRSSSSSRSTSQSISGDPLGYGFNQIRTTSHSLRNGVNRGSRFSNGSGRQRFGQEERGQGMNLMPKDQRLGNGSARQHIPSYYSVPLEDLRGQIAFVAKDHVGCRFLQKKIEEGKMEEIEMIFNEVMEEGHDHFRELMVDQFGTEFIQKLVEGINREGWTKMLDMVMSDERKLKDMCTDQHGYCFLFFFFFIYLFHSFILFTIGFQNLCGKI